MIRYIEDFKLEDFITRDFREISDFTYIPSYNQNRDRRQVQTINSYYSLFEDKIRDQQGKKSQYTYLSRDLTVRPLRNYFRSPQSCMQYKTTANIIYKCQKCSKIQRNATWKTTLGVCDIYYTLCLQLRTKQQYEQRKQQNYYQKTKNNQKKRSQLQQKFQLTHFLYTLQGEINQGYSVRQLEDFFNGKKQQFLDWLLLLTDKYKICIDFDYKIYKQQCRNCQTVGKIVNKEELFTHISQKFSNYIYRLILGVKLDTSKSNLQQLKGHKRKLCQACRCGHCPYYNYFSYKNQIQSRDKNFDLRVLLTKQQYRDILVNKHWIHLKYFYEHFYLKCLKETGQNNKNQSKLFKLMNHNQQLENKLQGISGQMLFQLLHRYHQYHILKPQQLIKVKDEASQTLKIQRLIMNAVNDQIRNKWQQQEKERDRAYQMDFEQQCQLLQKRQNQKTIFDPDDSFYQDIDNEYEYEKQDNDLEPFDIFQFSARYLSDMRWTQQQIKPKKFGKILQQW